MEEIDITLNGPFELESGGILPRVTLRCSIYGKLNRDRSNAILVFHALTGSSRAGEWWSGIVGGGRPLDTSKYAIVCVNYLGSCYGSTSAREIGEGRAMPIVTAGDIVRANVLGVRQHGIEHFQAVVGGSVGGMLALQLAVDHPEMADHVVSIAATPLSAMGLALNHLQRLAIEKDDLELARKIALISYKAAPKFDLRFGRKPNRNGEDPINRRQDRFDIGGYLDHQGDTFRRRFEIESYDLITKAMDLFDLRDDDISKVRAKVSFVGISSDWLFPAPDVRRLARRFRDNGVDSNYSQIESSDGHDAFLTDIPEMSKVLTPILARPRFEEHDFPALGPEVRPAGCYS